MVIAIFAEPAVPAGSSCRIVVGLVNTQLLGGITTNGYRSSTNKIRSGDGHTGFPPAVGPELGDIAVTVGADT